MFRKAQSPASPKRRMPNKLIAGFAALSATAIIAASGFAAAATPASKPSKMDCEKAGFKNYGQCVKEWAHHKNHPGNGYGGSGNNNIAVSVSLDHSNNNIIQVIVNIFR